MPVVASLAGIKRSSAELCANRHQRILEQTALLQINDEGSQG